MEVPPLGCSSLEVCVRKGETMTKYDRPSTQEPEFDAVFPHHAGKHPRKQVVDDGNTLWRNYINWLRMDIIHGRHTDDHEAEKRIHG